MPSIVILIHHVQIVYKEAEKSKKDERKEETRKKQVRLIHCQIKNQRVTSFSSNNDHDK